MGFVRNEDQMDVDPDWDERTVKDPLRGPTENHLNQLRLESFLLLLIVCVCQLLPLVDFSIDEYPGVGLIWNRHYNGSGFPLILPMLFLIIVPWRLMNNFAIFYPILLAIDYQRSLWNDVDYLADYWPRPSFLEMTGEACSDLFGNFSHFDIWYYRIPYILVLLYVVYKWCRPYKKTQAERMALLRWWRSPKLKHSE